MGNRYIAISEFGDYAVIRGYVPSEFISAAKNGYYDIIDITNPDMPTRYSENGWVAIETINERNQHKG